MKDQREVAVELFKFKMPEAGSIEEAAMVQALIIAGPRLTKKQALAKYGKPKFKTKYLLDPITPTAEKE